MTASAAPRRRRRAREAGAPYLHGGPLPVRRRLEFLVEVLGNNVVAEILGVNPSQASRWRAGRVKIGPENERRIIDLDYVVARLLHVFQPEVAGLWLAGSNPTLGGGRPMDALRMRGADALATAIAVEEQAAYH